MDEGTLTFETTNGSKVIMGALAAMVGASAYFCMRFCVDAAYASANKVLENGYTVIIKEK